VATAPTTRVIVSAHWALVTETSLASAIAGISGAPRLLMTATSMAR
jgi:hypothetical protein